MPISPNALGAPFAVGATADIHGWRDGYVLKLFHAGRSLAEVEHEARVADAVHDAMASQRTFRVPAVGPLVTVGDRWGVLYERIDGPSLMRLLETGHGEGDAMNAFARQLADLHAALHARAVPPAVLTQLPLLRDRLHAALESAPALPPVLRAAVRQRLSDLPDGEPRLCHGDLHPANLLLPPQSVPVLIDWNGATCGNPLADVARTVLLLRVGQPPQGVPLSSELAARREAFCRVYLENYCQLRFVSAASVEAWLPVVAAARLNENPSLGEQGQLLAMLRAAFPDAR